MFLGMNIKISDETLNIPIKKHIKNVIDTFKDEMTRNVLTSIAKHLFQTQHT